MADHVACSSRSRGPLTIPPLHLWGPPGVGKTRFASDLAKALEAPIRRQSMENAQTTSLLLGTERHWSNAAPGIVFEEIVLGDFANPVFLIDEIDKAPRGGQYDPVAPLHSLLEPLTATKVRDASLDMEFDASLAIYIATSNDPHKVPSTLLSRFRQFEIRSPRGEDALQVARVVVSTAIEQRAVPGFAVPDRALAHKLAHLTAREISQAVHDAVARAAGAGRSKLVESDFPAEVLGVDRRPLLH
ncbi:AAA family ATPase [Variovorax sp. HW608]|uniref:AAA family ATPase n=1 Tax=Variovorax sp. HW608 TaxID=1034889 RepID=UPI0022B26726|nr:AAA family ATPase [Variovorax sp. HW608]